MFGFYVCSITRCYGGSSLNGKAGEKITDACIVLDIQNHRDVLDLISIQKQHNETLVHLKTYSHLDARLQLRRFWDLLRRIRMRVRVHYGSFHRRCRSYVSLSILSDGSKNVVRIGLTSHPPLANLRAKALWYLLLLCLQSFS